MLTLLKALLPTVITLAVGTFWLNRFFVSRANLAALVERVCDALDALKDDCAEYWSVPYSDDRSSELTVLEAQIKGRMQQISALVDLIQSKRPELSDQVRVLLVDLHDACTGGEFESKQRQADRGRFMRVVRIIYKIAVELQRLKIWGGALVEFIDAQCHDLRAGRRGSERVI